MSDSLVAMFVIVITAFFALWAVGVSVTSTTSAPRGLSQQVESQQWNKVANYAEKLEMKAAKTEQYFR